MIGKPLGLNVKVGDKRGRRPGNDEGGRAQRSDLLMMFRAYFSGRAMSVGS